MSRIKDQTKTTSLNLTDKFPLDRANPDETFMIEFSDMKNQILSLEVNDIGIAGDLGFGVGLCPSDLLPAYLVGMTGYTNRASDNFGNYVCSVDGSIMVWIPAFVYKITNTTAAPFNGTKIVVKSFRDYGYNADAANADGYALHRAFVDGGALKKGFFVDKYKWSLTNFVYNSAGIASSIKNSNPISSSSETLRNGSNLYAGSFSNCKSNSQSPADIYGGAWAAAKSRGNDFAVNSIFIRAALAMLSVVHGQASTSTTNNAWYDATGVKNFPKGNNNYGADYNEAGVTFSACDDAYWSARNEARKNGSGSTFAKTTHNGQNCGVADLNGNQYEISQGLTNIGGVVGGFKILKESIALKNVTGGSGGGTDHFNNASIFDAVTLPTDLTDANGWTYFGNSTNQIFSGETNRANNAYLLTAVGLPQAGGSGAGINMMGIDGLYKYKRDELCPVLGGGWSYATYAGVWYVNLTNSRAYADGAVSGRACLYV